MIVPFDRRSFALLLLALLAPGAASADTTAVYQSATGKASLTFAVKGAMIRLDAPDFARDKRYALYDGARGTVLLIDDARKEYMEITPESLRRQREQMQAQLGPMMEQLKKQMKHLPPEQRRMIEKKMSGVMADNGAPAIDIATKETGSGRVNGIPCKRVAVLRDGKPMHEMCLASRADANIPVADYETMRKMLDTMRQMASAVSASSMPMAADIDGVPVEMKNHMDGSVHTLTRVSTEPLPATLFAVPAYKKTSLGSLMGLN